LKAKDGLFDLERIERDYAAWTQRLMSRGGFKTKKALFKEMKLCHLEVRGGDIRIVPTRHEKLEGWGGLGRPELTLTVPFGTEAGEIGAGVKEGLERCA
jgi:hypothetical protein